MAGIRVLTQTLDEGGARFETLIVEPDASRAVAVFAAGRGGKPARHKGFLQALGERGLAVIAPEFDMLEPAAPRAEALESRARRLALALESFAPSGAPIAGIGHSIGATMVLGLAGGEIRTRDRERVVLESPRTIHRLALFAPAVDFFQAPGALDRVRASMRIWVGSEDTITPPARMEIIRAGLGEDVEVDVRLVPDAGYFTFMNELPPNVVDPHPDREGFLAGLAEEVSGLLLG